MEVIKKGIINQNTCLILLFICPVPDYKTVCFQGLLVHLTKQAKVSQKQTEISCSIWKNNTLIFLKNIKSYRIHLPGEELNTSPAQC